MLQFFGKMTESGEANVREQLLKNVKKEVKQIMEEAVTRKFVHEDSCSVTSLCGAVEACLLHGLRKRALGLFKNSTTMALLAKVSKSFEPAAKIQQLVKDREKNDENNRKSGTTQNPAAARSMNSHYLWIRLALFEKLLAKIVDYLINNAAKYYDKEALIADSVDGLILASLLVGPCSLEYSKMKTPDHYWTDPPADELVQRHRIHSSTASHSIITNTCSPKRPGLQIRKNASSSSGEELHGHFSPKDYVKSLHQNTRSILLYGKNNVLVQPNDSVEALPGYLSLHQDIDKLTIKWTPNQLMSGGQEAETADVSVYWDYAVTICLDDIVYIHCHQQPSSGGTVVLVGQDGVQRSPLHFPKGGHLLAFLSCLETGLLPHGQLDPPLWSQKGRGKVFPKLKRKTSSMSSAWSNGSHGGHGPSLSSTSSMASQSSILSSVDAGLAQNIIEEDEPADYVFRIISSFQQSDLLEEAEQQLDFTATEDTSSKYPWAGGGEEEEEEEGQCVMSEIRIASSSAVKNSEITQEQEQEQIKESLPAADTQETMVKQLCDSMRKQILSRAFYGWLSHCRHLKTVRTHLSGLVNPLSCLGDGPADCDGLTVEKWRQMSAAGEVNREMEIYRLVYHGGCAHGIRAEVWPYLLGWYKFGSTETERKDLDMSIKRQYETLVSEWLAVEAIVRQQDAEALESNLARMEAEAGEKRLPCKREEVVGVSAADTACDTGCVISESSKMSHRVIEGVVRHSSALLHKDSTLSNDVFESMTSDDASCPVSASQSPPSDPGKPDKPATVSGGHVQTAVRQLKEHQGLILVRCTEGTSSSTDEGRGDSIGTRSSASDSRNEDDPDVCGISVVESDAVPAAGSSIEVKEGGEAESAVDESTTVEWLESDVDGQLDEHGLPLDPHDIKTGELGAPNESGLVAISPAVSPAVSIASNGGIYSAAFLENVSLNIHRIDKDVQRCDRTYWYFNSTNLDKLRNIMCTYVWENIEVGYIQGMCDLVAPILVILDDEAKTYGCFCQLMKRMVNNFPHGGHMDQHFGNMRSLIQILDPELFEHMHQNGDFTHFYFCYRWFLLDFKRELLYDDVFNVWELIWSAKHMSSSHFGLFFALALVEYYRDIIIDNDMDFTDIIKFFNEMAERHDVKKVMQIARDLVAKLQDLLLNQ